MTSEVTKITTKQLAARFAASERWWRKQLPQLRELGLLSKRGRFHFGDVERIADWLMSSEPEQVS